MTRSAEANYEGRLQRLLDTNLSRRSFFFHSLGSLLGLTCSSRLSHGSGLSSLVASPSTPLRTIPPLFCIAYIDPTVLGQEGQEAIVARYPLTLVPQDVRIPFVRWRDRVKGLNPSTVVLGYQMVIEETTVPGPGHDKQRELSNAWCVYPGGFIPTVPVSKRNFRIFDPRKKEWQDNFLEACRATLNSYPYDGLFLDQCTVFERAHPFEGVKAEMRQAIQDTLVMVRKEFPFHILVGNSSYHWRGLNGELNEGRPNDMGELSPFEGHVDPRIQLYHSRLRHSYDIGVLKKEMAKAHSRGAFYGAAVNYQHVLWFDEFDEVLADFKRASKKQF